MIRLIGYRWASWVTWSIALIIIQHKASARYSNCSLRSPS
jgi:hypothetical protein